MFYTQCVFPFPSNKDNFTDCIPLYPDKNIDLLYTITLIFNRIPWLTILVSAGRLPIPCINGCRAVYDTPNISMISETLTDRHCSHPNRKDKPLLMQCNMRCGHPVPRGYLCATPPDVACPDQVRDSWIAFHEGVAIYTPAKIDVRPHFPVPSPLLNHQTFDKWKMVSMRSFIF